MLEKSNTRELTTDHPVEQRLNLVTLGEPTAEMRKVIDAARHIAADETSTAKR